MRQAPPPPAAPATPAQAAQTNTAGPASAQAMYQAARAYRRELQGQLERLEEQASDLRGDLSGALSQGDAAARASAQSRLASLDARIAELDKTLAAADQQVATAAALPGATAEPPGTPRSSGNDAEMVIPIVFIVFVMGPIAAAAAWRWVRRGEIPFVKAAQQASVLNEAQAAQLAQLTQTMDAMALEIERIGEGQRFLTRVMSDPSRSLAAGGAQPLPVNAAEGAPAYRAHEEPRR
ncbi:MAG: hypothetical protein KJT01_09775 [Gemmatimonadetes bacterium]|nr:hypothetical protein [Gemmatimonadota bacterium]